MEITKISDQGILIKTKNATLAINAIDAKGKLLTEAASCDFAISTAPFQGIDKLNDGKRLFSWPGEYEFKGVALYAFPVSEADPAEQPDLLYVIYAEQFAICFLPKLKKELHSDLIEKIGDIDLLILPADGDMKICQSTLEEIEPKSILPVGEIDTATHFSGKLGLTAVEASNKLNIKSKADFSNDKMGLFLLN